MCDSRRQHVHQNKEDASFCHELNPPAVDVIDVASVLMKGHRAILHDKVGDTDDGAVHVRVLEDKLVHGTSCFVVMDGHPPLLGINEPSAPL